MCKVILKLMFIAFLMAIGGCRTASELSPSVVYVGGKALSKRVTVENINGSETATGTKKVWASIRNNTNARLMLEGRAIFLGDKGEPVEPEGAWHRIFIEQGATASFEAYSQSTKVKQVTIEVREGI